MVSGVEEGGKEGSKKDRRRRIAGAFDEEGKI